jgi:hypothetical protein
MQSQALLQPTVGGLQPVMVAGIEVNDAVLAHKVKMTLIASAILLASNLAFAGFYVFAGILSSALVVGCCGFLVPACGYFGAKNKDKNLLCAFWGCNACSLCCSITSIIGIVFVATVFGAFMSAGIAPIQDCCKELEACTPPFGATDCSCHLSIMKGDLNTSTTMYPTGAALAGANNTLSSKECQGLDKFSPGKWLSKGVLFFLAAMYLLPTIASCLGCVYGYQLYNHPTFLTVRSPPPPPTTPPPGRPPPSCPDVRRLAAQVVPMAIGQPPMGGAVQYVQASTAYPVAAVASVQQAKSAE